MKCYYEILELERDADDGQIKTAYRKMALKWHPDKNIDNTELAKEQFQLVQQAYEVLSDKHERAWYDNHREQILRGGDTNFQDDSLDVFQYFTTQCFKGYNDDKKGFYTVYRNVFDKIAQEDIEYMDSKSDYDEIPTFGNSTSDYEETVGPFYAYWMSYSTRKSYVWLDPYNIKETRERRVLKLIEKENKKVRQKAKKERNEEIRNLVAFVRKRDKRVQVYAKILEARNVENRNKQEQMRKQKIIERKKEINTNTQAEWSKFDNVQHELKEIEKKLAAQFGENITDSDEESVEEDCEDLYCVACNKIFKNPKAFANHESSKKHKENVEKLKIYMQEENMQQAEENLADEESENEEESEKKEDIKMETIIENDSEISLPSDTDEIEEISPSKKKNKKNKKVIQIHNHFDSDTHESDKDAEKLHKPKDSDDEFDFNNSKKQKKKNSKNKTTQDKTQSIKKTNEITEIEQNTDTTESKPTIIDEVSKNKNNKIKNNKNKVPVDVADVDVAHCCVTCKSKFNSKNKLFDHLKKTGHSVLLPQAAQKTVKSKKKVK